MELHFQVQNVKCQGCATAIRDGLAQHPQVRAVQVDVATGRVVAEVSGEIREVLSKRLKELGYPEKA